MIAVAPVVVSRTASPLRRKMLVEMRVRHLSPRTEEAYVRVIEAPSGLRVSEVPEPGTGLLLLLSALACGLLVRRGKE